MVESIILSSVLFLLSFSSKSAESQNLNGLIVELPNGKLQGLLRDNFISFRGIPYAEPPIGNNRFENPKPYTAIWSGLRDGTKYGNVCMQWDGTKHDGGDLLAGKEDCLVLNVDTPSIRGKDKYPVIVHIHGGGFMFGTANTFGGALLLRKNKFVVVSLNYRVGPLGFLSTKDDQISGNWGLKDQQLALRWIKENIHIFNGNSENITITGWSAGGASVHYQLLSERNKGLFNAAVSHSGTAFCAWATEKSALERAMKLANYVGCPTYNTRALKNCLKSKPAEDIVRAVRFFQPYDYNPFTVFSPVVEHKSSKDPFITDNVESFIRQGKSLKVPWIVSYTHDDGGYNALTLMIKDKNGQEIINNFDDKWPKVAPFMLFYNDTKPPAVHAIYANRIKRSYLGDENFSNNTYRKLQTMFTDYLYLYGIEKTLRLHINYGNAPVYIYHFNRSLPIGEAFKTTNRTDFDFGSVHGDDVFLIFHNPGVIGYTKDDLKLSEHFANLYESLATKQIAKFDYINMPINRGPSIEFKQLLINDLNSYKIEYTNRIVSRQYVL